MDRPGAGVRVLLAFGAPAGASVIGGAGIDASELGCPEGRGVQLRRSVLNRRSSNGRSPTRRRGLGHEKATNLETGALTLSLGRSTRSEKGPLCSAFREWRDPDSNRGHHDFQDSTRKSLTRRNPCSGAGSRRAGLTRAISAVCGVFGWDWVLDAARVPNGCSDRCCRRLARSESVIARRTRVLPMAPSESPVAACARR
jgi:hypothetical protein